MRLNDRPGERQPYTDPIGFGGKEWREKLFADFVRNSWPRITNCYFNVAANHPRFNNNPPGIGRAGLHGLYAVHQKIDQYLSEMNAVAPYARQARREAHLLRQAQWKLPRRRSIKRRPSPLSPSRTSPACERAAACFP